MPLFDEIRANKLIDLARERFDPNLTDAELKVLRDSASSVELPEPKKDAPQPEISAEFIRWLATDPEAAPLIDPKGLRVYAATILGKLDLSECRMGFTLDFRRCEFGAEINLLSAETRGIYIFASSLAEGIGADRIIIHGPLFLQRIRSKGEIRLLGAEIAGQLNCNGAKLKATGNALSADGAKIGGGVFLTGGFESEGAIRLLGAKIAGGLECSGAKLKAKSKTPDDAESAGDSDCSGAKPEAEDNALIVDGAKIGGDVFLNQGFESEGEIRLLGAEIGGVLDCSGAKLKATGNALSADQAKIGGDVFLTDGFEAEGEIRLLGAEIGGDVAFRCAKVAAVSLQNAVITGDLIWQRIEKSPDLWLSLAGAKVKNLRDDRESWPNQDNLLLDGLVYEELTLHAPLTDEEIKDGTHAPELSLLAKERIEWILLQSEERRTEPQPWMQLRDLLEKKGERKEAKYVLRRFRCLQAEKSWFLWRWWKILFAWIEESPFHIAYPMAVMLLLGWLVFCHAGSKGALAPTERAAYQAFTAGKPMPDAYPALNPFVYTLENAVPLVRLGQDDKWAPDRRYPSTNWLTNYWFLMWARWALIILGWVQATVLVAALSDRFRK